jgi:hypothetical protein
VGTQEPEEHEAASSELAPRDPAIQKPYIRDIEDGSYKTQAKLAHARRTPFVDPYNIDLNESTEEA